jgi:phosphoribosylamine--glycine ligase
MRLENDLFDIMKATIDGTLSEVNISWKDETSLCVVISAKGYPGSYEKGKIISGLDSFKGLEDTVVFHSGTATNNKGELITSGGRVLGVTALGSDIRSAKDNAYRAVEKIHFDGMHVRKDIGDKGIKR